jgi:hypothetical protein
LFVVIHGVRQTPASIIVSITVSYADSSPSEAAIISHAADSLIPGLLFFPANLGYLESEQCIGLVGGEINFLLTCATPCRIIEMVQYSISQAARLLEIHRATLHRWIEKGLVPPPISQEIAGSQLRYWTEDGLAKLREYKALHYRKKPRLKAVSRGKRSW